MSLVNHSLYPLLLPCVFLVGCDHYLGQTEYLGLLLRPHNNVAATGSVLPPVITISPLSQAYVSASAGAINATSFDFQSSAGGAYSIQLGGSTCADGTVAATGTVIAGTLTTTPPLDASSMAVGGNTFRVCVVDGTTGGTGEAITNITRDDTPPTVTANPGTGNYGTIPGITLSCADTGGAGCDQIAYTINSLDPDPAIAGTTGTITAGSAYSAPVSPPDAVITPMRYLARDRAGNVSAMASQSYTVDATVATITVTPDTVALAAFNGTLTGKLVGWSSSRSGPYTVLTGGTDCTNGTSVTGTNVLGSVVAAASQSTTLTDATPRTADVKVRICVQNLIGNYGFTDVNFTYDITPPYVVSTTPAPSATGNATLDDVITVTFSKAMNTTLTPTLTTGYLSTTPATYTAMPVSPTFTWSADRTVLTVHTGWIRFPENSSIQWSLSAATLQDVAGNALDVNSAPFPRTFTTGEDMRAFALFDTGQSGCYDNAGASILCTDATYPGQDGAYSTGPVPSFTAAAAPPAYPADFITSEAQTGLVWRSCLVGNDFSGGTCAINGTVLSYGTWGYAMGACASLNSANGGAGYAGIRTWRLPTLRELQTTVRYTANPAVDSAAFPGIPAGSTTSAWTSTGYATTSSATSAATVATGAGYTYLLARTSTSGRMRCVSGTGTRYSGSYVNNHDGTVTDTRTGLTWQKCLMSQTWNSGTDGCDNAAVSNSWPAGLQYCASQSGWRLPNVIELESLLEPGHVQPYFNTSFFATGTGTGTPTLSSTSGTPAKFLTYFGLGIHAYKSGSTNGYIRCVRGP